LCDEK